jgi:predicted small integral membrane protein
VPATPRVYCSAQFGRDPAYDRGMVRVSRSANTPLVVGSLLIAAALMLGVWQIKSVSIERAYRHTQHAAASVVSVGANGVADVRYLWGGKPRTGQLNVSTANGVDRGDRLAVRVSDGGRRLQLETPFYGALYPWTAAALASIAVLIGASSWHSSAVAGRRRKQWLPAELTRPRRHYRPTWH